MALLDNLLTLHRLPIKALKLDRSLLRHCTTEFEYQAVMGAILATAKTFDLKVVV